ncbi:hypothetical protein [Sphingobacterium multivorum]|uniref:hypothetical protein n=1 Tax=Sphingobacterium TaxID=28453 RepID=UPI00267BEE6F|nr:hypothetical protein [Sphingobacterium multivorum]
MKLDFYKPINETLRKYIKGYYFISKNQDSGPIKYWTFPNDYCILTVNQQFEVEDKGDLVTISSSFSRKMNCMEPGNMRLRRKDYILRQPGIFSQNYLVR